MAKPDATGQFDLFPEPPKPDPYSSDELCLRYANLVVRLTKIGPYLSPAQRIELFGEESLTEEKVARFEELVARVKALEEQRRQDRIA